MDFSWKPTLKFLITIAKNPLAWVMMALCLSEIAAGVLQVFLKNYSLVINIKMIASWLQSAFALTLILYKNRELKNKLNNKEVFMKTVHWILVVVKATVVGVNFVLMHFHKHAVSVELSCVNQLFESFYTLAFDRHEESMKTMLKHLEDLEGRRNDRQEESLSKMLENMDSMFLEEKNNEIQRLYQVLAEKDREIDMLFGLVRMNRGRRETVEEIQEKNSEEIEVIEWEIEEIYRRVV